MQKFIHGMFYLYCMMSGDIAYGWTYLLLPYYTEFVCVQYADPKMACPSLIRQAIFGAAYCRVYSYVQI